LDSFSTRFKNGFVAAFSMMIVSEIGDKTFFIAAIMAMRHNRLVIFTGAISALAVMSVLSAYVGTIFTYIPPYYTHYAVTALFFFFGIKLLKDGVGMADDEGAEELEEVTQELKKTDEDRDAKTTPAAGLMAFLISPILLQAFTLTFLAEWGDRSQIATIALGANEDPIAVSIGATLGHACCTFMAVMGGRLLATKISVRSVTIIGGVVFISFAIANLMLVVFAFSLEAGLAQGMMVGGHRVVLIAAHGHLHHTSWVATCLKWLLISNLAAAWHPSPTHTGTRLKMRPLSWQIWHRVC
jgi:putative Ca2+/H+ antiporter (TMEM165/GDT1 family)